MSAGLAECQRLALEAMLAQKDAETKRQVAELWAPAWSALFLGLVTPIPLPTRPAAIAEAEEKAIALLEASTFATTLSQLSLVAQTYALAVVASSTGGIAVPPPGPFVPAGSLISAADASVAFAGSLLAWAATGTFTVPPSAPIPWV